MSHSTAAAAERKRLVKVLIQLISGPGCNKKGI